MCVCVLQNAWKSKPLSSRRKWGEKSGLGDGDVVGVEKERKREREKEEIHQTCKFSDAEHVLCKFTSLPLLGGCPWLYRAGRWAPRSGPSFPRKASLTSVCLARIGMCALHLTTYVLTTLPGLGMVGDLLVVTCCARPRNPPESGRKECRTDASRCFHYK